MPGNQQAKGVKSERAGLGKVPRQSLLGPQRDWGQHGWGQAGMQRGLQKVKSLWGRGCLGSSYHSQPSQRGSQDLVSGSLEGLRAPEKGTPLGSGQT